LSIANGSPSLLLNLVNILTLPELFTELAEGLKFLRAGKASVSVNSLKIVKPDPER